MKKLIPAYVLSFVIVFMLYIVEPISMFVNNRNDFHFNLNNFIIPMLLVFFIMFILLSLMFTIIYFINKKFSDKLGFFNVIMIISYILFILLYIQGNFLTGNLPKLDGSVADWSRYGTENLITIVILLVLIITYVICCIKFKFEKVINISKYISISICAMLFIGLIPSLLNGDLYSNRRVSFVANRNINNISKNKNFLIFLVDAADSTVFEKELEKSKYKDILNDFTYYPDTLSMYLFTRDSIPQILSGKTNHNETKFSDYYNTAMDESPLIDRLINEEYNINLYEAEIKWNSEKSKVIQNVHEFDKSFSSECYMRNETKYLLFKYLPYFLKKYSKIDYFNLNSCKTDYIPGAFASDNMKVYNTIKDNSLELIDDNYFSFIHIDGAHVPFNLDGELNSLKNDEGTYTKQIDASITIVNAYIERLKENNSYDNSVIIVMADHGYKDEEGNGSRTNPILYIKGFDEHHDKIVSDKAISYADLMEAYNDLLDGKKSTELFKNIGNSRERTYIWYNYLEENHMVEMTSYGKAWDFNSMKATGKKYNR